MSFAFLFFGILLNQQVVEVFFLDIHSRINRMNSLRCVSWYQSRTDLAILVSYPVDPLGLLLA